MPPRLSAGMLVSALVRRLDAAGGSAMVLKRGDETAGGLLLQLAERGVAGDLLERVLDPTGSYRWTPVGPADPDRRAAYLARRQATDPDLWLLELDSPRAAAIVAEVAG